MHYDKINVPADGEQITVNLDGTINVPDRPIVPFIEGDGIGPEVIGATEIGDVVRVGGRTGDRHERRGQQQESGP